MDKWPGSQELNETAFNIGHNTTLPFFGELGQNPSLEKSFINAMEFFAAAPGMEASVIADNYNWSEFEKGLVVDIGGSHGAVALELASKFPDMNCIVQDRPEVISQIQLPKDATLAKRVRFQAHDFLSEQPVKNADVYLLRMILHNWTDKYCIQILRQLIPALKLGARIIINDHIVPSYGELPNYQARSVQGFDWVMKLLFNAMERDLNDWTVLLEKADPRFHILEVTAPGGTSTLQIISIEWV